MENDISLLDAVILDLQPIFHGTKPWYERVADEHRAEIEALRQAWKSGQIAGPEITTARIISAKLRERGIAIIGPQGVLSWLKRA